MEKRFAQMQGLNNKGLTSLEKEIISWHEKVNNHKIHVDTDICRNAFLNGNKIDILTARQVANASVGEELKIEMNYYAAETGRSTTTGVNIQGLKKGSAGRKAIVPHKGNIFVKVDSSSIEPRCLALLSEEKSLINMFKRGIDVYEDFGKSVGLGRAEGKVAFLASMYGQGNSGIISLFNSFGKEIDLDTAKKIRYSFIKKYPRITGGYDRKNGLWQKVFDELVKTSRIALPSGRVINYRPQYKGKGKYGESDYVNLENGHETRLWFGRAVNNLVQGTARDIFFYQVSKMVIALDGIANICWTVHDDAVFECKEKDKDKVAGVLRLFSCETPHWFNEEYTNMFVGKISYGYSYNDLK